MEFQDKLLFKKAGLNGIYPVIYGQDVQSQCSFAWERGGGDVLIWEN